MLRRGADPGTDITAVTPGLSLEGIVATFPGSGGGKAFQVEGRALKEVRTGHSLETSEKFRRIPYRGHGQRDRS